MIVWGIKKVLFLSIGLLIASLGTIYTQADDEIWLAGSLEEIKSASPLIGHATMPMTLARAIVSAVPPKYATETKEAGWDIETIAQAVEAMKVNDVFDLTINNMHLVIHKYIRQKPETPPSPSLLRINNPTLKLPVPLILTSTAITLLQYAVKEFKGMDAQLTILIEQIKKTPPGLILKGEDRLMNSWLEILLE